MLNEYDLDKRSAMQPLDQALSGLIGRIDPDGEHLKYQGEIARGFRHIAGQTVAEHIRAVYFDKGVVTVVMDAGIWAQELTFLAAEYRDRLNESLGTDIVTAVTFRTRPVR